VEPSLTALNEARGIQIVENKPPEEQRTIRRAMYPIVEHSLHESKVVIDVGDPA
jgi:hypothetical protein